MKTLFLILSLAVISCSNPPATNNTATGGDDNSLESSPSPTAVDSVEPSATTSSSTDFVYISKGGDKYHTADCRFSKDAQAVSIKQAKADGKTACDLCKPNSKTGEKQARCTAKTADGTQCKRMTGSATGKCFQHQ